MLKIDNCKYCAAITHTQHKSLQSLLIEIEKGDMWCWNCMEEGDHHTEFDIFDFEVFLNMGKAGGCAAQCESIGRLISYSLRIGGDINEIIKVIKGIRCHQPSEESLSCADAIAEILHEAITERQPALPLPTV